MRPTAYSATKAALSAMTRAWAAEFSPGGVRVNAVAPGPVHTGRTVDKIINGLAGTTLMDRPGTTNEIAEVIAFPVRSKASQVTDAVVAVDGGRTARSGCPSRTDRPHR